LKSIRELSPMIRSGSLSVTRLTAETFNRISKLNSSTNSFITVLQEVAMTEAERAERQIAEGRYLGPLHGIPVAVKDNISIRGVRSTAGSKILGDRIAAYDSTVVRKLHEAGAIIVGTTNMHEFAGGATSVNPFFGPVRNPWDTERISGGSSGGSAAAVSAGMAAGALGTDTAGSLRIPAAFCGVVGLKPTFGSTSRFGVVPAVASFDTVGVIAGCVWDAAVLFSAIAGKDDHDSTTIDRGTLPSLTEAERTPEQGKIAVPRSFFFEVLDEGVSDLFERFLTNMGEFGLSRGDLEVEVLQRASESIPSR
jgi:aspartyl-tRNA(Asn)/glutamyl-tRNA(Gln) amidotransferase subunit A